MIPLGEFAGSTKVCEADFRRRRAEIVVFLLRGRFIGHLIFYNENQLKKT